MPFSRLLNVSVFLACLSPFAASAQTAQPVIPTEPASAVPVQADSRPVTRGELPGLIRETLMSNPAIIKDAVQKLREQQEAEAEQKSKAAIAKHKTALFSDANAPSAGAKDADVTFVEFFDYHCGYCRHILPAITQMINEDKKVRFVFVEYPILSEDSVAASRAALAVNRIAKDKYFAYHTELMKHEGKYDEKSLLDIAKKLGIDADKLKAEMVKPEITAALDKNRELGGEIGVSGTPALIVGNELIPGAIPFEELKRMTVNVRAGKSPLEEAPAAPVPAKN